MALICLSGPPGVGKSTVGRLVAETLGYEFVDLDAKIAADNASSVEAIFQSRGEPYFRELEAFTLAGLLDEYRDERTSTIVALGGGAITQTSLRWRLLDECLLISLTAPIDALLARIGKSGDRPLLSTDPARQLRTLLEARRGAYAECHAAVSAVGSASEVAAEVASLVRSVPLVVPLGTATYRIHIAKGALQKLRSLVAGYGDVSHMFVIVDEAVVAHYGNRRLEAALAETGAAVTLLPVPSGEAAKTLEVTERIWSRLLGAGVDRRALIVSCGGGTTGDLAGFVASTVLRGLRVIHLPTTLLAMVDSSVGGKTGINRPEGKNLVGTFHQPAAVLCDTDFLDTLPDRQIRSALAEVVKAAWLAGEEPLRRLEADVDDLLARSPSALERAIRESVRLKIDVVREDEREQGRRRCLNLGHTVGHAFEAAAGFGALSHGEAVALGLCAAAYLSDVLLGPKEPILPRMRGLLARAQLPTDFEQRINPHVLSFLLAYKKREGDGVTLVLLTAPGSVVYQMLSFAELRQVLDAARQGASAAI